MTGWKVEWHLLAWRIVDIDPVTKLPMFQDFICTSDGQTPVECEFMNKHVHPVKKNLIPLITVNTIRLFHNCTSDESNKNLSGAQNKLLD